MNNTEYNEHVMIALLPTDTSWSNLELPHMTLVYCGEIKDLKPTAFNEMAKDASSIAAMSTPIRVEVLGIEIFGEEQDVNVLKLRNSPQLNGMRRFVNHWNKSQFPFNPHATIGPVDKPRPEYIPSYLTFDRIIVCWGEESLTFSLYKHVR